MEADDRAMAWLHARYGPQIEGHKTLLAHLRDLRDAYAAHHDDAGLTDEQQAQRAVVDALAVYDQEFAGITGVYDMWTFHGIVFAKAADYQFAGRLESLPASADHQELARLFEFRLRIADELERMWALYDHLNGLAAQHQPLTQEEAAKYASWLSEIGLDPGEVTVAAAQLHVAVLEPGASGGWSDQHGDWSG